MDFGTVLGFLLGLGLVAVGIGTEGGLRFFFEDTALLLAFGGTVAACLISTPLSIVRAIPGMLAKTLVFRAPSSADTIARVVRYAEVARREGIPALEDLLENEKDPYLKHALGLVVEGTDPKILILILELEIRALEQRHVAGQNLLISAAGYAPAFGMVGTLIGLIQMLLFLNDPTKIGHGMAVALVTTFWGALLSNLVFHPLAMKLRNRTREEKAVRRLVIEGITSIQEGDSPRVVREKLQAFLSPEARLKTVAAAAAAAAARAEPA
jgi:chemotaxis protein MotA